MRELRGERCIPIGTFMSRRKKSHQTHGTPSRPRFWGRHAVAAALDNPDRKVLRAWATRDATAFMQFPPEVPVTLAEAPDLGRLVPHDAPHQGVVIEAEPLEDIWLGDILQQTPDRAVLLVLDQVTDPHNVGAILRSAAAFGAIGIVTQDRHSPPESGVVAKAASGALERMPWARVVNLARALEEIGEAGFWRIGLTGDADLSLGQALGPPRVALVLGAEGPGLRPNTREHCDALARLPISDAVESLNVSNAAAVALYAASQS
jgi:23S rRNA (guanosine2251-2'-O)-methyltransferase